MKNRDVLLIFIAALIVLVVMVPIFRRRIGPRWLTCVIPIALSLLLM